MDDKIKKNIKHILAKVSKYTGITKLFYKLNKNRKIIIAYHNVIPDKYFDDYIHLDFSIKESLFKKHIEVIKKKHKIGLDLYNPNEVTLTFDDGYLNQYLLASKILDSYNVNGYFFYAADLLNKDDALLIDKIQYWIDHVKEGIYKDEKYNLILNIKDNKSRRNEWHKINKLIKNKISFQEIYNILDTMSSFKDINIDEEFYKLRFTPIKKDQIDDMKKKGHKIGAHSSAHNILSYMKHDDLVKDISKCKELLDLSIYNTKTFCYPYGGIKDVSNEAIDIVKYNGFSNTLAFTNEKLSNSKYNEFFIPRMTLPNTYDEDYLNFLLSGAYYFIKNFKLFPKFEKLNNSKRK